MPPRFLCNPPGTSLPEIDRVHVQEEGEDILAPDMGDASGCPASVWHLLWLTLREY